MKRGRPNVAEASCTDAVDIDLFVRWSVLMGWRVGSEDLLNLLLSCSF